MAPRARAAASACLVASGLLISGAGGAIALADPGQGHSRQDNREGSDSHTRDDSVGENASNVWQRPDTRWGNGRWNGPGARATSAYYTRRTHKAFQEAGIDGLLREALLS